ncbi:efflux transporter outer membrane subunit [Sphingomonas jatrophae]|uniref:Efflux transporter, outer membrane factor (OMF) lipoprotein, NodT family n=1 Tax=Sphingomonas jatrophae TaxID=1166337 RepID=A0A1I6KJC2_9SPHN|nr:efflux transporter outer membrane subunit [Sphingomonas jatrophae]SFR91342.1 efflux transporter, outer membrane factor (OMF) lipoprotein, NodT family [Sphingomonas jatrophae]
MRRFTPPALLALALAGCTTGPDYAGPPPAAPNAAAGGAFRRAGDGLTTAEPVLARWWEALGDPTLNALEARALAANPDIAVASARLRQARAEFRTQRANRLPNVNASALYAHARVPGLDLGSEEEGGGGGGGTSSLNVYNLGFDSSWEVDLFGGTARAIEAARAGADAAEARLADAQVSLTASVAEAYLNLRDRQARFALNQAIIARQEQALALTRQRLAAGTVTQAEVERLVQALDGSRADITPLRAQRDSYLDLLATLTGTEPGVEDAALGTVQPVPLPPEQVAIGDPAALLQRRPDIRAAERTLAADTARIGQARAARFPRLSFMGIVGIGGSRLTDLTKLDDLAAIAAPQLSWGFLDFGRNRARITKAEAVRDESEARYRGAVLTALRDAEGALSRFGASRVTLASLARAERSAGAVASLARQRYAAGTGTLIEQLEAEQRQMQAEQALIQARANLTLSYVAIAKALGLGWDRMDAGGVPAGDQAAKMR